MARCEPECVTFGALEIYFVLTVGWPSVLSAGSGYCMARPHAKRDV